MVKASSLGQPRNPACADSRIGSPHAADASRSLAGPAKARSCAPICRWKRKHLPERLRVVIAEDNYLVREGTRRRLEDSGEVDVLASVSNAQELLQAVDALQRDAVLSDIRMAPGRHVEDIGAAHAIRKRHPQIGVVVLSQHSDAGYAMQLLKDGT